jgi:hypothetical protein
LLDASAVVRQMHGHTIPKAADREAMGGSGAMLPDRVRIGSPE